MGKKLLPRQEIVRLLNEALQRSGLCEGVAVDDIRQVADEHAVANWDTPALNGVFGHPIARECVLFFEATKSQLQERYDWTLD